MTDMENELAAAIDQELSQPLREPVMLRPLAKPPSTLAEQVQQLQRIEHELANRIRREGVEAQNQVERKIADAHADFARTLSEETARLERQRDEMIRQANDEFHGKLHELAALLRHSS